MQNLGLSEGPPRSENRIKTLVWPTIESSVDVDTLTSQGLWICWFVGLINFIVTAFGGHLWVGLLNAVFYLLAGLGIRRGSLLAAAIVWFTYTANGALFGIATHTFPGILWVFLVLLLSANVRGIWLSAKWRGTEAGEPPPDTNIDFTDTLTNRLPVLVWPLGRWLFFALALIQLFIVSAFAYRISRVNRFVRPRPISVGSLNTSPNLHRSRPRPDTLL